MESFKQSIIKAQPLTLINKAKNWQIDSLPGRLTFHSPQRATVGWHRVTLKAQNSEARVLLKQLSPQVIQNRQLTGVSLLDSGPDLMSLVFYRHHPLRQLLLEYAFDNGNKAAMKARFTVKLKVITAARAWMLMLSSVAQYQAQQGFNKDNIYRLSRARQKRAGYQHALRKLVQEYQPLLSHQLTTCEPYEYWRLYCEPQLMVQQEKASAPFIMDLAEQEPLPEAIIDDKWYRVVRPDVADSRYFNATLAEAISSVDNSTSIIYWDHDYLDDEQERVAPEFKPDWNPDYFAARDYISGCFCVRGRLLKQVDISQWPALDSYQQLLILLLCNGTSPASIYHLDKLLQHLPLTSKPTTTTQVTRQRALLSQWLQQQDNIPVSIASAVEMAVNKINYELTEWPHVTLIVPTRDGLNITRNCIDSVLNKTNYPHYEILIVDNQSSDPETLNWFEQIQHHPKVQILRYDAPFNYSAINNFAAQRSNTELLCFLNNDTEVINPGWLREMAQHAARPSIGCVGAKLYFPDNTIQHAGVVMGIWGLAGHSHKFYHRYADGNSQRLNCVQNYSAVTAACLVLKKRVFEQVGGFNEKDLTVAFNDVDLCLKVQQHGFRNLWTPYAELYHYESKSRGKDTTPEKRAREQQEITYMQQRWSDIIAHDPAYNANLTRMQESFDINFDRVENK